MQGTGLILLRAWLEALLFNLPFFIVCVIGIVIAWRRRHRHPQLCKLLLIVLSVAVVDRMIFPLLFQSASLLASTGNMSARAWVFGGLRFLSVAVTAGLWALMIWAVFGWRRDASELRCDQCGYDLRGTIDVPCPECGEPFGGGQARR